MHRRSRRRRVAAPARWMTVAGGLFLSLLLAPLAAACGDSDELLNEYGAEGAHQTTIAILLDDGAIGGADDTTADGQPLFHAEPHTDLTFSVRNAGAQPHRLSVYADAAHTELLVASPEVAPGATAEVRFHFHDPQLVYLRDDRFPETLRARLAVGDVAADDRSAAGAASAGDSDELVPVTVTIHGREDSPYQATEYRPSTAAPALRLERGDGATYDLADRERPIAIVMFGYVNCGDVCPLIVANYAQALRQLTAEERAQVEFLMVTVDPERETPAAVQGYVDRFGEGLLGLGGTPDRVLETLADWGIEREIASAGSSLRGGGVTGHTSYTVIIDGAGQRRLKVPAHHTPDQVTADLRTLLRDG